MNGVAAALPDLEVFASQAGYRPSPLEGEGTGERGQRDSFVSTQTSRYDSVTR